MSGRQSLSKSWLVTIACDGQLRRMGQTVHVVFPSSDGKRYSEMNLKLRLIVLSIGSQGRCLSGCDESGSSKVFLLGGSHILTI